MHEQKQCEKFINIINMWLCASRTFLVHLRGTERAHPLVHKSVNNDFFHFTYPVSLDFLQSLLVVSLHQCVEVYAPISQHHHPTPRDKIKDP